MPNYVFDRSLIRILISTVDPVPASAPYMQQLGSSLFSPFSKDKDQGGLVVVAGISTATESLLSIAVDATPASVNSFVTFKAVRTCSNSALGFISTKDPLAKSFHFFFFQLDFFMSTYC